MNCIGHAHHAGIHKAEIDVLHQARQNLRGHAEHLCDHAGRTIRVTSHDEIVCRRASWKVDQRDERIWISKLFQYPHERGRLAVCVGGADDILGRVLTRRQGIDAVAKVRERLLHRSLKSVGELRL